MTQKRISLRLVRSSMHQVILELAKFNKHSNKIFTPKFANKYDQKLLGFLIYLTHISILKNVYYLLGNENPIGIPALVRSSIDLLVMFRLCHIDLDTLLSDYKHKLEKYIKQIEENIKQIEENIKQIEENIKQIEENIKKQYPKGLGKEVLNNLNSIDLIDISKLLELLKNLQNEIKELNHISSKNHAQKAKRYMANLEPNMELDYSLFSSYIHTEISTLYELNTLKVDSKITVRLDKKISKIIISHSIYIAMNCLNQIILNLVEWMKLPKDKPLKDLCCSIKKCITACTKNLE